MMAIFIPWDVWFTHEGVWWFNDKYISGYKFFLLPIEEWLFFIIIPFCCVFVYEVLNYTIKKDFLNKAARPFFLLLSSFLILLASVYHQQLYTFVTSIATAIVLLFFIYKNPLWKGRFLLMYLIIWFPFLLVNGVLTGGHTSEAVVNYNPEEFIGLRVFTIPIEDSIYNLLMLLMVVWAYERVKKKAEK